MIKENDDPGYLSSSPSSSPSRVRLMTSNFHYNENGDNDHADDWDDELLVGKSLDLGHA